MTYVSPTKPMAHQEEALHRRMLRPPGYADVFADNSEMGCGKSATILYEWQKHVSEQYVTDLLVVAPAGCLRNWHADKSESQPSELKRHLDPRLLKLMSIAAWSPKEKDRRTVRELIKVTDRPRALFVNVEAISTSLDVTDLCIQFLCAGRAMMVIDESTCLRGQPKLPRSRNGSIRTKRIVLDLAPLAKARRILTGLMTPKSPLDLYWQFHFLDKKILGHVSYATFQARYALTKRACYEKDPVIRGKLREAMGLTRINPYDGYLRGRLQKVYDVLNERTAAECREKGLPEPVGRIVAPFRNEDQVRAELELWADDLSRDAAVECILRLGGWITSHIEIEEFRNLDELQAKIAPFSHRVLKKDCMDLPDKIYQARDVELTTEQQRMYKEILQHAITELEGQHVRAPTVLAQMTRLHQVVLGHCVDETGAVFDVPSRRIDALMEVLADHSGKAIIWSSYRREIDKIVKRLSEEYEAASVASYHGGNKNVRDEEERRFLTDPRCKFMVSTQAAGGRGNTWIVADLVIYCGNNYDLEHRMQSEDRSHRKGQTRHVTYVDLICRDTVEERIVQALRGKIDLATVINGENYRSWLI
jgi:hypothetical protein